MTVIYSCPDCDGDLEDDDCGLWCQHCESSIPYAVLATDDDGDSDDHDN
jgi:hypothetical protein